MVGCEKGDRYLIVNPFFHSFGYKAGWLSCVMRGATAVPTRSSTFRSAEARSADENISVLPGARRPSTSRSSRTPTSTRSHDLSNLRLAVTGAAAIPVELIHRMRDELGFDTIITAYGLTETCGMVTMCRPTTTPRRSRTRRAARSPASRCAASTPRQGGSARRARRGRGARLQRDARLLRRRRGDRARPSTPTAGSTPATSA